MLEKLLIATSNKGKLAEFAAILAPIQCISQSTFGINSAEETGLSFIENAIIKARHASHLANMPALADDSGLVVKALNGKPGIFSARFAGNNATDNENNQLLLNKLKHVEEEQREGYFYCALALVQHADDPTPLIATGMFVGKIATEPAGTHGFGYDSIFYIPEYRCTAAQLTPQLKNTISHRAQALKQLKDRLTHEY